MASSCHICGNSEGNITHRAREMMFGTREEFDYFECAECGTLQLVEFPADMSPYYPSGYFSFDGEKKLDIAETFARRVATKLVGKHLVKNNSALGKFIAERKTWIEYHFPKSLLDINGIDFYSRILDFGCGAGTLLQKMHYFGFRNLTGADAFIERDISYPTGVNIYKRALEEIEPAFDVVMLHHSFEHLPDSRAALHEIHRILETSGTCMLRIPVKNFAWEKYGVSWVQMDPPRHLYLYTENAIKKLARENDFTVEKVVYDSDNFQFWGSEQYINEIPLYDPRSYLSHLDISKSIFTEEQMNDWQREAEKLNASGRGDQACFYLRKN